MADDPVLKDAEGMIDDLKQAIIDELKESATLHAFVAEWCKTGRISNWDAACKEDSIRDFRRHVDVCLELIDRLKQASPATGRASVL